MEKTIVTTGATIDIAIESALAQLGLDRDSVSVQVLQQAKAGFLGFGKQLAKVQVTYEAPDPVEVPEKPKSALGSASRSKPKAKPIVEKKPETPKAEPVKEAAPTPKAEPVKEPAPKAETAPKTEKPRQPKPEKKPAAPRAPREPKVEAPKEPKIYAPAEAGSTEEKIEVFLKGLLEKMGSVAVPHAWKESDGSYKVDLVGADLGYLIGRRGDTLDAIQHLANYTINRDVEGHIRINIDAEQYRQKREDSLRRYARKKAQQVLKARRRTTLEPMNAYERHVIHAALQDMDNITTHSTGTEPNRRVVIEYVR
ncbi:MAG: Jag N-terminal domain-containing protein [Oscillospiraceae bacterium]|nr:Jag N-terminal domain-containing protein [Oscillospiraceae bacterium]